MTKHLTSTSRITSIDLLRGVVMIIMALDHTRDYFHTGSFLFDPTDLTQTSPVLFFTRWITHFCAPVFVFLAGTSAFISGQRKTKKQLSIFLITRGLWLLLLEVTIVSFAWSFNIHLNFTSLQVIWALGISMITMAALIHLPIKGILIIGVLITLGHNLLDNINFDGFVWAALHETKPFQLSDTHVVRVAYPVLAWIGIMALGYCFGNLYTTHYTAERRRKWLFIMGLSIVGLFLILRAINLYGDPRPWEIQDSTTFTFLSFLNTQKYPPSLLYTLMTLGPSLLFLASTEKASNQLTKAIIYIGRVPLFYYVLHLYLIHFLAMIAAEFIGFHWYDMIVNSRPWREPHLKGFGFSLLFTYVMWIVVVLILYPLCKWYDTYKTTHKDKWWLSYL